MTAEEVLSVLGNIAPEADPASLRADVGFREHLDVDSMDLLNFVVALHERLGVDIPETPNTWPPGSPPGGTHEEPRQTAGPSCLSRERGSQLQLNRSCLSTCFHWGAEWHPSCSWNDPSA
jgi:acyl carrier protein